MTRYGMGVMLHMLSTHDEAVRLLEASMGKTIQSMWIDSEYNRDGGLGIKFIDGEGMWVFDDGRSCCEERYIHTDDDLQAFAGATLTGLRLEEGPNTNEHGDRHEMQFLLIDTSLGTVTLETHNLHNGYYGGFWITVKEM